MSSLPKETNSGFGVELSEKTQFNRGVMVNLLNVIERAKEALILEKEI
jgi:hypothetical protein